MSKKKKYPKPGGSTPTKPAAAVKDAAASDGSQEFSVKRIKSKETV